MTILAALLAVAACGATNAPAPTSPSRPSGRSPSSGTVTHGQPRSAATPASRAPTRTSSGSEPAGVRLPRPDHVVVVVLENHSYGEVIGSPQAPFIASLAASGAVFTESFAVTHPSQPNYLALFSGSTQGIVDDSCPHTFTTPNLARELLDAGDTFIGYSEGLPSPGFTGCSSGRYARKHNPWVDFSGLPASVNQPFTAFPSNYASLPTVSFVIPDLDHDMHDGTIAQADQWLRDHLSGYAAWARTHRSLLVLTCDEDDASDNNRIPTVIAGASIAPGRYAERIDHYRLLRTLTDAYGLAPIAGGAGTTAIKDVWAGDQGSR